MPGADRDLVAVLDKRIKSMMENVFTETKVIELKETSDGIQLRLEGSKVTEPEQIFDKVLISVGRKPVTTGFGLENTKVKVSERGFVIVDKTLKTDDPNIYAIGDIVGNPMLAHKGRG